MLIDKRKLIFKTLLKKGDTLGAINELISILKGNYEKVQGDFQSIYDHHEILISLLLDLATTQGCVPMAEQLTASQIPDSLFPPLQSASKEHVSAALTALFGSFSHYAGFEIDQKTTNHHNCRKSALLSQLLMLSKSLQFSQ